jgi:hypothetical protein
MKVWPYEVVQVKRGSVEVRNPCATVDEARARAGRFWDAIVKNRAVAEWHPDAPREARRAIEAWLVRRDPPVPLGEVEDAPPVAVRAAVEALAEEPEAPAHGLAFLQPEGVCVVCGATPQRHRPTLPEALRLLCKRHRTRAQVLRSQGGLTPEAAVAAITALADAPPSRVIELPPAPPPAPHVAVELPSVAESLDEMVEPEILTVPAVYPPATCTLDPSGGLPGDGLVRVFLGPRSVGAPVWGRHVAPGVVEVTGVRLSVEHAL